MEKSMTYRRPISGCAAVECSLGKTLMVEHRPGYPAVVSGTIIDRLREYEEIGTPEYFKRLAKKEDLERARRIAINSIYGTGLKHQMSAIENLDISQLYPATMFAIDTDVAKYIETDVKATQMLWEKNNPHLKKYKPTLPEIDRVIFNNPATIVFWKDGTKTIVQVKKDEPFDPEKGLAMAMVKKALGNKGNYYNVIRDALAKQPIPHSEVCHEDLLKDAYHCLEQCDTGVNVAYSKLCSVLQNKKATKADLLKAIESAVGSLGELVDEGGPLD